MDSVKWLHLWKGVQWYGCNFHTKAPILFLSSHYIFCQLFLITLFYPCPVYWYNYPSLYMSYPCSCQYLNPIALFKETNKNSDAKLQRHLTAELKACEQRAATIAKCQWEEKQRLLRMGKGVSDRRRVLNQLFKCTHKWFWRREQRPIRIFSCQNTGKWNLFMHNKECFVLKTFWVLNVFILIQFRALKLRRPIW